MLSRLSSYFSGNGYQKPDDVLNLEKVKKFATNVNSVVWNFPKSTPTSLNLNIVDNLTQVGLTFPSGKKVYVNFFTIGSDKYKITRNDLKFRYESYHNGDASEALVDYLTGYTATIGEGKIGYFGIHGNKWPSTEILDIEYIRRIPEWGIDVHEEIYNDFMDYMSQQTDGTPQLKIIHMKGFKLPASFYKSKVFREAEQVTFDPIGDTIMDEDFLMAKSRILEVKSSLISDQVFNEKLHQWFDSESKNWKSISMDNWDSKLGRIIDKKVILDNLPYKKLATHNGYLSYRIVRKDGDMVEIKFPVPSYAVKANFNV